MRDRLISEKVPDLFGGNGSRLPLLLSLVTVIYLGEGTCPLMLLSDHVEASYRHKTFGNFCKVLCTVGAKLNVIPEGKMMESPCAPYVGYEIE